MPERHPVHDAAMVDPVHSTGRRVRRDGASLAGRAGRRRADRVQDRLLFENNPLPMWIHDVETLAFLDVNEAAIRRYNYTRDEFLAMTIADIGLTTDGGTSWDEGRVEAAGWSLCLKDGNLIEVEIAASALEYRGRRASLVLVTDVSSRCRTEEALRAAEAKYRDIFENAVEGIFQTSPEGRYLNTNPALARIYGYDTPAELIAGLTDIGRQLYVDPVRRDEFARSMRERDVVEGFESQVRRRDGSVIWISESSRAVRDARGRLLHYEGFVKEITDRKRAEEEIRTLNAELERRLGRVKALRRIDVAITEGRDLASTLEVCIDEVISQLQPDAVVILLCDRDSHTLHWAAGRGLRSTAPRPIALAPGQGLAGKAVLERRIVHMADLSRDRENSTPHLADEDFVAYHAVPLESKGQVKGVLEVFHSPALDPGPDWLAFLEILAGQTAIAIDNSWLFEDFRRSNTELAAAYDATIEGWSRALDLRDEETEGHSRRVTEMTLRLAQAIGHSESELVHVRRGALLHDIGKMGIPDQILHKPGPLSEEEWRIMRRHPQYAHDMLLPISFLRPALDIPYCHHERWDGTGYPRGLRGEEIPLAARIFAAVDIWDALRSARPYRPAWPEQQVYEHLRSLAGTHLDPTVVRFFLQTLGADPPDAEGSNTPVRELLETS